MSEVISVEIPTVGESISEVQIGQWLKQEGDYVKEGEDIVEIETEKASVQIPAPASGVLQSISKQSDEFAIVGDIIASIDPNGSAPANDSESNSQSKSEPSQSTQPGSGSTANANSGSNSSSGGGNQPPNQPRQSVTSQPSQARSSNADSSRDLTVMPAAQRLLDEHGIVAGDVQASGPGNRLLKEDVLAYVRRRGNAPRPQQQNPAQQNVPQPSSMAAFGSRSGSAAEGSLITDSPPHRMQEVKQMSMLRRTIASRLVQAQQTAALLTTFNEIDMAPVMEIRSKYKDAFNEKHGVKLGFMSFFAKAAVEGLRKFPAINAEVRDGNFVYHHYHDIGIAIGGGKGLVVPVLRNVERMSFSDVERSIGDYAKMAGENRLQPEDLMGGTFTISNGGVYGSLLSTPIVNPPQSGILGLHSIQQRPVAVDGEVVIRPMMYVALTYDHRIVDGREAVGFLKTVKDVIEDPARLFLEL